MTPHLDIPRIQSALALLGRCSPGSRLLALQNLCENNDGIWTIPKDPERYRPVLFEVSLYGVPAVSEDPERLPDNWKRAAENILAALPCRGGC